MNIGAKFSRAKREELNFENHQSSNDDGVDPNQNDQPHAQIGRSVSIRFVGAITEKLFAIAQNVESCRQKKEKENPEENLETNWVRFVGVSEEIHILKSARIGRVAVMRGGQC